MSVLTGIVGGLTGGGSGIISKAAAPAADAVTNTVADAGLNAIASWVLNGTKSALQSVAGAIGGATAPDLTSTWFSATYLRVAGLAVALTLPFLFAAVIQALLRSDPALLARVVFGYLPLSLLAIGLATPVTMLLLAATDQMCDVVSATALHGGAQFLDQAAAIAGATATLEGSPFLAVAVGLMTVAAALALSLELLVREAAVYVVVLMLPLAFAAFVWPARRIWAVRMVELLISLILAKFVIVAVLSLAGSAFGSGGTGLPQLLTAMALLMLATFAPWTLMRILPFTELAAGAAGALRHELPQAAGSAKTMAARAEAGVGAVTDVASTLPGLLRRQAGEAGQGDSGSAVAPDWHAGSAAAPDWHAGSVRAPDPGPPERDVTSDVGTEPAPPPPLDEVHQRDPSLRFRLASDGGWTDDDE